MTFVATLAFSRDLADTAEPAASLEPSDNCSRAVMEFAAESLPDVRSARGALLLIRCRSAFAAARTGYPDDGRASLASGPGPFESHLASRDKAAAERLPRRSVGDCEPALPKRIRHRDGAAAAGGCSAAVPTAEKEVRPRFLKEKRPLVGDGELLVGEGVASCSVDDDGRPSPRASTRASRLKKSSDLRRAMERGTIQPPAGRAALS